MKVIIKSKKAFMKSSPSVNWILIIALIVLLGFSVLYIYNIHYVSKNLEKFHNSNDMKVVYIYNPNCGYCRKFNPVFEEVKSQVQGCSFDKIDVQQTPQHKFSSYVDAFPTILLVDKQDNIVQKQTGYMDINDFHGWVVSHVQSA